MDFDSMTEKDAFKAGFLAYCKEANLGEEEIAELVKVASEPTWGEFGYEFLQNFNPWNGRPAGTGYGSVLDRWYNPYTTQQVTEKGEHGLMRAGQYALGTGAAAAAGAGAVAAGAPSALYGLGASGLARAAAALRSAPGRVIKGVAGLGTLGGVGLGYVAGAGKNAINSVTNPIAGQTPTALLALAGLPIAAGLAAGGGLGWGAAKLTEPRVNDDDIKAQEIETAYKVQAQRAKARRDYEQYRRAKEEQKLQQNSY